MEALPRHPSNLLTCQGAALEPPGWNAGCTGACMLGTHATRSRLEYSFVPVFLASGLWAVGCQTNSDELLPSESPTEGSAQPTDQPGGTETTVDPLNATGGTASEMPIPMTDDPSGPVPFTVEAGGFVKSGGWQGLVWIGLDAIGSTATPATFSTLEAGSQLCLSGTVSADAAYGGFAALGWNLNQETPDALTGVVVPDGEGLNISVTNNAGSPLRVQIEGPAGATDAAQRWCKTLGTTSTDGNVSWSEFSNECWEGGAQVPFDGTSEIARVLIQVPGHNEMATPFDFCLNSIGPATEETSVNPGSPGTGGSNGGSTGGSSGVSDCGIDCEEDWGAAPPGRLSGGQSVNRMTRFWDCCKPHCAQEMGGWSSCDANDNPGPGADAQSACVGGGSYTCWSLAPWAEGKYISYARVATNEGGCGECFQIDFTSGNVAGKTILAQKVNIGHDLQPNSFDLLIPGGGVGLFNGCSQQWGVDNSQLGETYGGFLQTCRGIHGWAESVPLEDVKECVRDMCDDVFSDKPDLLSGCNWFIDWFHIESEPDAVYQSVPCPSQFQ